MKNKQTNKIGPRSNKCKFVGYPKETYGYYFYNPKEQNMFVLRHDIFLEEEFLLEEASKSKIELKEIEKPQIDIELGPEPLVDALDAQ